MVGAVVGGVVTPPCRRTTGAVSTAAVGVGGRWAMANGQWMLADGLMADGRWMMADGRWPMGDGRQVTGEVVMAWWWVVVVVKQPCHRTAVRIGAGVGVVGGRRP